MVRGGAGGARPGPRAGAASSNNTGGWSAPPLPARRWPESRPRPAARCPVPPRNGKPLWAAACGAGGGHLELRAGTRRSGEKWSGALLEGAGDGTGDASRVGGAGSGEAGRVAVLEGFPLWRRRELAVDPGM